MNAFTPATKSSARLRLALFGPSGSGKTYTALSVASGLADGGTVAVIDTEHGSASLYADEFAFDVNEMSAPYDPRRYVRGIQMAADAGYDVVVVDSITHAWNGTGGVLELVDDEKARQRGGNDFTAWKVGTKIWRDLLDVIIAAPVHVIVTARSKTSYVIEMDDRGKSKPRKVGLAPEARDGIEYEFTCVGELDPDHRMVVTKSRMAVLADRVIDRPGRDLGVELLAWLNSDRPSEVTP